MRLVDLFYFLEGKRTIAYSPEVAKLFGGITEAIFFLNISQWIRKEEKDTKEIHKTAEEIESETALTIRQQMTARAHLKSIKVLKERHARLEHRIYYSIDEDGLNALLETIADLQNVISPSDETETPELTKQQFGKRQNVGSLIRNQNSSSEELQDSTASKKSKPKKVSPTDTGSNGSHKAFVQYYCDEFEKRFATKYYFIGGKDGSTVKRLLTIFDLERLKQLADAFFSSNEQFIVESGFTIGVFASQVNKLNIKERGKVQEQAPRKLLRP